MKTKEGLWKLSPSGLYGFDDCKACFWLEQHHGKGPGLPWLLNSAMDSILKARYDEYRTKDKMPPEVKKLEDEGISLFKDTEALNKWRGSTKELKIVNEKVGFEMGGKIDDLLIEPDGKFIPMDFKSSGYAPKDDKQKYYVSQLNAYALMFREHGHEPSDRAYLLHYFVKDTKDPSLSVEFTSHIDLVKLDLMVFENKLADIVDFLNKSYPGDDLECEYCSYYTGLQKAKKK
ncbi:MAG: PD-(D/E)XK nuclease family protein [Candidatus Taylorbacteria bacterium]|nr:PD-(D/E)XK nuclease family protein [Candidatus Taylorbacteria bacterium]